MYLKLGIKMKHLLILILLLLTAIRAKADYGYMSLSTLVCDADYGATGTIVKLDKSYFYLKVEKYVLGVLNFDTLQIKQFTDWSCGKRYEPYRVGQRELVFFRKSNYLIDDYDFIGYGGAAEFELPIRGDSIFYNISFGLLKSYFLNDFLVALKDLDNIKQSKISAQPITKEVQNKFSSRSELHKLFIECKKNTYSLTYDIPEKGYIGNLEINHLYKDYENKISIFGFDIDSIFLSVDDAEVWRKENYFIVKPKDAWTRRYVEVYALSDKEKKNALFTQIFEILELPEPRLYFGDHVKDTIFRYNESIPRIGHYLDHMHQDKFLKYELLSYTYTIRSGNSVEVFKVKSKNGTIELYDKIKKTKYGDQLTISDIYVLYPDNTVRQIKERTVIVGKVI